MQGEQDVGGELDASANSSSCSSVVIFPIVDSSGLPTPSPVSCDSE